MVFCIKKISVFTYLCIFAVIITGCTGNRNNIRNAKAVIHEGNKYKEKVHWGYEGSEGPESWGKLSPEYATCSGGKRQSPIDISDAIPQDLPDIIYNYQPTILDIVNNGHTIEVVYHDRSYIEIDGEQYILRQFHFHTPSEHTFNGKHYDMEMHLVHRNANGKLAVIGVMIQEGKENAAFEPIWDHLLANAIEEYILYNVSINVDELLPDSRLYYCYDGSLTTPPCTECVRWFVLKEPIELSERQIEAFRAIFEHDNRPVQPLNDRRVYVDVSPQN